MNWFRELLHELGNGEHRSVTLLRRQVAHASESAEVVEAVISGDVGADEARRRVTDIEHRGDRVRGEFVIALASAVAPPLDREDLFRISRSVNDVLDNLRDFSHELDLFGVTQDRLFAEPLKAIRLALAQLGDAIDQLAEEPEGLAATALQANKSSNAIRRRYQEAVAELLVGTVDAAMLRRRELLRRLDVVGLRLGEAADALADGAVKRNQ